MGAGCYRGICDPSSAKNRKLRMGKGKEGLEGSSRAGMGGNYCPSICFREVYSANSGNHPKPESEQSATGIEPGPPKYETDALTATLSRLVDDKSNSSNYPCNEMLLKAVRKNDIEEVERLLKHTNLNLNYDMGDGNTILFQSIYTKNEPIFMSLLNAGFDINISNEFKETPLHMAIIYSPVNFAHELVKRGANIEAMEQYGYTALCNAAVYGNAEVVCMLLYYGADVHATCRDNMTPFMWALENDQVEVSKILFNYYDDFSCVDVMSATALRIAILQKNPIAVDILRAVGEENEDGDVLLLYSLEHSTAELFKLVWSKFKEKIRVNDTFLNSYLISCDFSKSEWLECWHLLLKSPTAFEDLQHGKSSHICENVETNLMTKLLRVLYERQIELKDRLALIYLFLSFGITVKVEDINVAYLCYGFSEELEAFLYTFNYDYTIEQNIFFPLLKLIFVLEDDYEIESTSEIFEYFYNSLDFSGVMSRKMAQNALVQTLGFFSLSHHRTQAIKEFCQKHFKDHQPIIEKLYKIPEVPSLFELCRNETRKLITRTYNIKRSYQFHDIVKELNLPLPIRDSICFKVPIY